ncbi:hypothetical protein Misp04_29110 [Micromonospora sp. NBRC 101691]|nr:hypothetical protein Misp04_29110 [Micromonospora sp. NBRC 101691]
MGATCGGPKGIRPPPSARVNPIHLRVQGTESSVTGLHTDRSKIGIRYGSPVRPAVTSVDRHMHERDKGRGWI